MKNLPFKSIFLFTVITLASLPSNSLFPQKANELMLEKASVTAIRDESSYLWIATYGQGIYRYSKKR